jgi:hypothetical protein
MVGTEQSIKEKGRTLEYKGIVFTSAMIGELDQRKLIAFVEWGDVRSVTLAHGFQAKRPALQIGLGAELVLVGLSPLLRIAGLIPWSCPIWGAAFIIPGVWLIWNGMHRRYYLDIETPKEPKRLVFQKVSNPSELHSFLDAALERFGLKLED